ncbi:30S ribosomal protein THX [bacterium SCSIO 12741]|nr:30S ribosomal protein THX [bacterium SCSIO 12741]
MGKGDKKTAKGKRFRGSAGKTRQPNRKNLSLAEIETLKQGKKKKKAPAKSSAKKEPAKASAKKTAKEEKETAD